MMKFDYGHLKRIRKHHSPAGRCRKDDVLFWNGG